jgi:hypothetical protein
MRRAGWIAALAALIGSAGCSESTEVPLAKVAPVEIRPESTKQQPRAGAVVSPAHIEGHN